MVIGVGFEGVCVREVVSRHEATVPVVAIALAGNDQRIQGLHHLVERSADIAVVVNVHTTVQPQHRISNKEQ